MGWGRSQSKLGCILRLPLREYFQLSVFWYGISQTEPLREYVLYSASSLALLRNGNLDLGEWEEE